MMLDRAFTAGCDPLTASQRAAAYLQAAGYAPVVTAPLRLVLERGSPSVAWITFSPRPLKTQATLTLEPGPGPSTTLSVTLQIITTGQWVLPWDRTFWATELEELEAAVCTGEVRRARSEDRLQAAIRLNLITALVPSVLLAPVLIFATLGALFGMQALWRARRGRPGRGTGGLRPAGR